MKLRFSNEINIKNIIHSIAHFNNTALYIPKKGCYNGPFTLGATHGRQAPHHPPGQQQRAFQTGIQ